MERAGSSSSSQLVVCVCVSGSRRVGSLIWVPSSSRNEVLPTVSPLAPLEISPSGLAGIRLPTTQRWPCREAKSGTRSPKPLLPFTNYIAVGACIFYLFYWVVWTSDNHKMDGAIPKCQQRRGRDHTATWELYSHLDTLPHVILLALSPSHVPICTQDGVHFECMQMQTSILSHSSPCSSSQGRNGRVPKSQQVYFFPPSLQYSHGSTCHQETSCLL
jgi:hypothetical protein